MKVRRPVSAASPVTSWIYNTQQLHQAALAGHTLVTSSGAGLGEGGYITIGMYSSYLCDIPSYLVLKGSPQVIIHSRMQDPSKELIAESQRVKLQLRNLEKQLNDLKLATQGVNLSEGERLTQELQLIEQGIQERQKEACLVSNAGIAYSKLLLFCFCD